LIMSYGLRPRSKMGHHMTMVNFAKKMLGKENQMLIKKYDKMKLQQIIKSSRASSVQFSNRNYVDLYSFYSQLHKKIDATYNQAYLNKIRIQKTRNSITKAAKDLKESLTLSMKLINNSVVAKTAGKNLAGAQGLSIYFPYGKIDNSYIKTEFAQDSLWVKFLQETFSR